MRTSNLEPTPPWVTLRRLVFASLVALTVLFLSWESWTMLRINGLNPIKTAIFVLFVVLLIPIALFFWTAAIGLLVQLRGGDALDVSRTLNGPSPKPPQSAHGRRHADLQ